MPTENRRIATYLPKEVDEKFKAFKLERGIKGDSHALLIVLSEFLGVTESVAPLVNIKYEEFSQQLSELQTRFDVLGSELFSRLKSELLTELKNEGLNSPADSIEIENSSIAVPGQLSLLSSESRSNSEGSLLQPKQADGERWLTSKQAYEVAQTRGYSVSYGTFREWAREKSGECLKLYSLRRLESVTSVKGTPVFEDLTSGQDF